MFASIGVNKAKPGPRDSKTYISTLLLSFPLERIRLSSRTVHLTPLLLLMKMAIYVDIQPLICSRSMALILIRQLQQHHPSFDIPPARIYNILASLKI